MSDLDALYNGGLIWRRRFLVLVAAAAALVAASPAAAAQPKLIAKYCSPTGDVCLGVVNRDGAVFLELTTVGRYFERYVLCVKPPAGASTCSSFPIRAGGSFYFSRVRWYRNFPARGQGAYLVTWRLQANPLGPPLKFRIPLSSLAAPRQPTIAEFAALVETVRVAGSGRPCALRKFSWISGSDQRFAVLVWQTVCSNSTFNHSWLKRSDNDAKRWAEVGSTGGTNVQKAPCIRIRSVPADIRCR